MYNVKRGDRHAFLAALKSAMEKPIDRFILETMRQSAVVERLQDILSQDRLGMAQELLRQRKEGLQEGEVRRSANMADDLTGAYVSLAIRIIRNELVSPSAS